MPAMSDADRPPAGDTAAGPVHSTAEVPTARPARYGKQLVSHLGRHHGGEWAEDTGTGWIRLGDGRADVRSRDGVLELVLRTESADHAVVERLEDVVGRHLVHFGTRDELVVRWRRADGNPGTVQGTS